MEPLHMPRRILQRNELMKAAALGRPSTVQLRYKCDFDKNVLRKLTFNVGDYEFIDRSKLSNTVLDAAVERPLGNRTGGYDQRLACRKCSELSCIQ